ncbi:MAG TPA: SWIM zinc finger family protein [Crinalium sp.]|jgi:uncharacterized Zn finger protein
MVDVQPNREWWAQRWIDVLESFGWIRRLARARNYAREGNVLKIEFKGSKVSARVQGTAPDPYKVSLSLDPFTDEQWQYVIESLSERAIFSAKLLAGEMPQNIEEVFTANGLSLFPFTKFDIHSKCSCPDPANPCKHIGAVYYLLGDRFSEDPFVLFQLRGRTKEEIITALRQLRSNAADTEESAADVPQPPSVHPASSIDLKDFWQYDAQLEPSLVVIAPPPSSETVLDVLGPIPIKSEAPGNAAIATQALMEYLKSVYAQVSQQAALTAMNPGNRE